MVKKYVVALVIFAWIGAAKAQLSWEVQGHLAKLTFVFPQLNNQNATANVNWDPTIGCKATVGIIFAKNNSNAMGDFIGATRASRNLIVTVAGKEFSGTTLLAEYTNAFEAVMQASFDLLNSMRNSNEILFNVGSNRPIYVFPLVGAARAIELARFNCK